MTRRAWLTLSLLLGGCGTETGNPEGMVEFGYNARSTAEQVALQADGPVRVDAVWVRLQTTVLAPCEGETVEREGIGLGDHAGVEPAWQQVRVPLVDYCSVGARAVAAPGNDDPPGVDGAAVAVLGTLDDGRSFVVRWADDVDLVLPIDPAVPPGDVPWLLTFDVATWLDTDALAASTATDIVLPGDPDALAAGLALHEDLDGDGIVGPGDARVDIP